MAKTDTGGPGTESLEITFPNIVQDEQRSTLSQLTFVYSIPLILEAAAIFALMGNFAASSAVTSSSSHAFRTLETLLHRILAALATQTSKPMLICRFPAPHKASRYLAA